MVGSPLDRLEISVFLGVLRYFSVSIFGFGLTIGFINSKHSSRLIRGDRSRETGRTDTQKRANLLYRFCTYFQAHKHNRYFEHIFQCNIGCVWYRNCYFVVYYFVVSELRLVQITEQRVTKSKLVWFPWLVNADWTALKMWLFGKLQFRSTFMQKFLEFPKLLAHYCMYGMIPTLKYLISVT